MAWIREIEGNYIGSTKDFECTLTVIIGDERRDFKFNAPIEEAEIITERPGDVQEKKENETGRTKRLDSNICKLESTGGSVIYKLDSQSIEKATWLEKSTLWNMERQPMHYGKQSIHRQICGFRALCGMGRRRITGKV